jgi:YD repeat-containing protein
MAFKWLIGQEVTAARLNKTGKGFDNVSSITFNSDGSVDTIVDADSGYTYKCNYNALGQLTTLQEKSGATVLQTWTFTYDSEGKLTSIVNT